MSGLIVLNCLDYSYFTDKCFAKEIEVPLPLLDTALKRAATARTEDRVDVDAALVERRLQLLQPAQHEHVPRILVRQNRKLQRRPRLLHLYTVSRAHHKEHTS